MTCREFLEALAEDPSAAGATPPAMAAHRAVCAACAAAADDARDAWSAVRRSEAAIDAGPVPPARSGEAWSEARGAARSRGLAAGLRLGARAAVLLLAATGAFAALGGRVQAGGGRVSVDLSLPFAGARVPDDEAAGAGSKSPPFDEALAAFERRLLEREALRDEVRSDEFLQWAQWLDERHRADAEALATEIVGLRSDLAATRWVQEEMAAAGAGPPALPDPR